MVIEILLVGKFYSKGREIFMNTYLDEKQINDINDLKELIECKENVQIKNYEVNVIGE